MPGTPPCFHPDRIYLSTLTELLSSMVARAPIEHIPTTAGLSPQGKKIIRTPSEALEVHHRRELMTVDLHGTTGDVMTVRRMTDVGQSKIRFDQMQLESRSLMLLQVPERVVRQMQRH